MATSTLQYPPEILGALGKKPDELEAEGRLLLGLKYYENGELSGGLCRPTRGHIAYRVYIPSWKARSIALRRNAQRP